MGFPGMMPPMGPVSSGVLPPDLATRNIASAWGTARSNRYGGYTGGYEAAPPVRAGGLPYPEGGYTSFGGGFGNPFRDQSREYGPLDMYGGFTGGGYPYSYNVRDMSYQARHPEGSRARELFGNALL